MKILHINTNSVYGGDIAAFRLHYGLKSIGVDSRMMVLYNKTADKDFAVFKQPPGGAIRRWRDRVRSKFIASEINKYAATRPKEGEWILDDRSNLDVGRHPLVREADIVHLHGIGGMLDHAEFFRDTVGKEIVWTLHDMSSFTGGCQYAGDCVKYESVCRACPQIGSSDPHDWVNKIWSRKKMCYRRARIHLIAPTRWMADCARRSSLFSGRKIEEIPYGLPTSIFTRRDKRSCRESLGLPQNMLLILFGSYGIDNKRKGLALLIRALAQLERERGASGIGLVIFGRGSAEFSNEIKFPVYPLGYITSEESLSCVYSSADIFVIPSLEENCSNVCIESLSCGTPVVGFTTGGIPDMVRDGVTGLLAKKGDTGDLARQIKRMIERPDERRKMGEGAQRIVREEYDAKTQAGKCLKFYESIYRDRSNG